MSTGRANHYLLKQINSALIMNQLLAHAPLSRANLAQQTGLYRSTISSLVAELIESNLVREAGLETADSRGRPGMLLELSPRGGSAVGIEINANYIAIILTDFTAHILWHRYVNWDTGMPQDAVLALAEDLISQALRAGEAHGLRPLGIGVGLTGLVDTENGTLVFAPNLKWRDVPFREPWSGKFGLPVYVENDGNASAMGEYYFGVAKGHDHFLFIGTGTGLTGGLMLNGEIYRGAGGYAGEIGHIIVESGGELCSCGRRGCWETLVAPHAVIRGITHALNNNAPSIIPELVGGDLTRISMDVVVEAADRHDQLALDTLADIALNLGSGIANLVNIFNPKLIVLGGSLIPASEYLMPPISRILVAEALPELSSQVALTLSPLGMNACVKGAVALVIDGIVRNPIPC